MHITTNKCKYPYVLINSHLGHSFALCLLPYTLKKEFSIKNNFSDPFGCVWSSTGSFEQDSWRLHNCLTWAVKCLKQLGMSFFLSFQHNSLFPRSLVSCSSCKWPIANMSNRRGKCTDQKEHLWIPCSESLNTTCVKCTHSASCTMYVRFSACDFTHNWNISAFFLFYRLESMRKEENFYFVNVWLTLHNLKWEVVFNPQWIINTVFIYLLVRFFFHSFTFSHHHHFMKRWRPNCSW